MLRMLCKPQSWVQRSTFRVWRGLRGRQVGWMAAWRSLWCGYDMLGGEDVLVAVTVTLGVGR